MDGTKLRAGMLGSLGAAVGAFGAAAMMSAATAPAAWADPVTDVLNAVETEFTHGQTAFTAAFTDFGSNDVSNGLAQFFNGVDDDILAPNMLLIGTADVIANQPIPNTFFVIAPPADLTSASTEAQAIMTSGEMLFTNAATAFGSGDYANGVYDSVLASILTFDVPSEVLLIGAVEQLGL